MLKLPTTNEILDLIGTLTATVKDFAEREGKLNYALKLRISNLQQGLREEIEELERDSQGQIAAVAQVAETEKERITERLDFRKSKLAKAQLSARKALLDRIQKKEGYEKYESQKHVIDSGRTRDQKLQQAEIEFAEKSEALASWQKKFGKLESGTHKGIRAFGSLEKRLKNDLAAASKNDRNVSDEELAALNTIFQEAHPVQKSIRKQFIAQFFGTFPVSLIVILLLIIGGGLVPVLDLLKIESPLTSVNVGAACGGLIVLFLALFFITRGAIAPKANGIIKQLAEARSIRKNLAIHFTSSHESRVENITAEFDDARTEFEGNLKASSAAAGAMRVSEPEAIEQKAVRIAERIETAKAEQTAAVDAELSTQMQALRDKNEASINALTGDSDSTGSQFSDENARQWAALEDECKATIPALFEKAATAQTVATQEFLPWTKEAVESWAAPAEFRHTAKYGSLTFDLTEAVETLPSDPRLALPADTQFELPLALSFPESGSILFETKNTGNQEAIDALNNLILRIFTGTPAGRAQFTIIDPVGLGQNFAGIMHLADHEEFLISSRIWTQANQIEQQLADLSEYMEKVIQMYLRNEYATITEYNEKAGNIAEKYHFVVVADFPHGFTEQSAQRLLSIANTGARCGVYTLIHWDQRAQMPLSFTGDDLRKSSVCLKTNRDGFFLPGNPVPSSKMTLDPPPSDALAIDLVNRIGKASKDSNLVQVPFSHIAPLTDTEFWSLDTSSELRVPIGRTGATKLQYLEIGKGTCQHALIAGKTGSGKSTLFHVIITNLALWCDPDQVEFYLIDFKKGVEFKCYADAKLPQARVIAIESDREFGLSVLQRLDEELKRRGELFRKMGVQDVAGYKRAGGTEPVPRSLLLIDEFQEFFIEDDSVSQNAALLLDRIVRQGRAFGIHAILGSQTLGGAFTLARATLGQMVIRIALQCNEADAYLIMDDSNPASRMLTRPGEGIYNDSAGAIEGNSPFQVVWLGDENRDEWISKLDGLKSNFDNRHSEAVIFEGNAPADVCENSVITKLRTTTPESRPPAARLFLGAPNSIKGPTEIILQRQSGNNVLIIGQRDETVLSMIAIGLLGLKHQFADGDAKLILIDGSPEGSSEANFLNAILPTISAKIERPSPADIGTTINALAIEMNRRVDENDTTASPIFCFINGLQKFKKLRYEDDFSFSMSDNDEVAEAKPGNSLNDIITEGAGVGIHLIVAIDTFNNLNRAMSRKAITEFEMRVLFQMSANDSASLIDTIKASTLGLNRALFYNEQAGYLETFRPYSQPDRSWFSEG
ncbi:FtsK/SpoIIIE domain-containing protein [bacterium]|nr:FtsK/SpoIIIE domain-containing protein [bacterium]